MDGDLLPTELHIDEADKTLTINRIQDVEPIIELNKYLQTVQQKSDWGRHVATIPNIFYEKWIREEWDRGNIGIRIHTEEFDKLVERKLQDPDWRWLRTDKREANQAGWSSGLLGFGS